MHIKIEHETTYHYDEKVSLSPHVFRLFPRIPGRSELKSYHLSVEPPGYLRWVRDAADNDIACYHIFENLSELRVRVECEITTLHKNPFDFVLTDGADVVPPRLTNAEASALKVYQEIASPESKGALSDFLNEKNIQPEGPALDLLLALNRCVCESFDYSRREEAGTQSPLETLEAGGGSCRDLAWLFVEAIRGIGFAARMASGYLVTSGQSEIGGDGDAGALHAWAEVFLPGAGWVGFDPTNAVLVDDSYVPTAVGLTPSDTLPVEGSYYSPNPVKSHHSFHLSVEGITDE